MQEETAVDHRYGRIKNPELAGCHFPGAADIRVIETDYVPEKDKTINELDVKGLGAHLYCRLRATIADALFHATRQATPVICRLLTD